jgi:trk system potassium uptake protein TrkH
VGLSIFDAVNTAFTALATGGFSVRNGSIGSYNNLHAEIVVMVFLIIGATNFFYMMGFFRNLASGRFSRNMESETFLIILSISILLLISIGSLSTRISAFQAIAASTNCGFQTTTLSGFSDFNKIILTMLMIIGGSSGSTAGGIKIFRIIILFFAVYWYFKKLNLPENAVFIRRLGKRTFSNEEIVFIISYAIVYVASLFVGALILAAHGHSFVDSAFEAASAIGNTGLSVGLTSISMSSLEKIVLMFEMWIGRVEIFSVLLLFIYPASVLFKHIKRKLK